jgi:hypothetical protein
LQYTGSSRTLQGARAEDFLVANLTLLSEELLPGLETSAAVYNLLDERFGYPGSADNVQDVIEQNGRSVQGKITIRFCSGNCRAHPSANSCCGLPSPHRERRRGCTRKVSG